MHSTHILIMPIEYKLYITNNTNNEKKIFKKNKLIF